MGHVPSPAVTRSTGVRLAGGVPAGDRRRLPELPYRVSGWCGDGALAGRGTSAPDALAVAVGAGVPAEHLLRVPPQQRVRDVGGRHEIRADLAVTDHEVLPAGSPLTSTCKSHARQLRVLGNGQSVRPHMIVTPRAKGGIAPRRWALARAWMLLTRTARW